jgi:enamine deaminase RidA (YjgF/YER057c/UK114 family)
MEIINPEGLTKPKGYSNGMRQGNLLAIAGQVAWDSEGRIVGGDFVRQFGQALRNIVSVVVSAGGREQDIAKLTIFVTDKDRYLSCLKELGAEYRAIMGKHYPAMTLVEVSGLVEEGAIVEIEGLAFLPTDTGDEPSDHRPFMSRKDFLPL